MPLKEPVQIVINAGAGAYDKEEIVNELAARYRPGDSRWNVSVARNGPQLLELVERAVKGDCQTIVAGGGDGTIAAVAGLLVGTTKTLGVLPLGTLNHFAKDLDIPLDLDSAMETILQGHTINVDIGQVNGRTFINNSSLGLYPQIIKEREKQQRLGWGKWPAFAWAAISVLRRYPLLDVSLSVEDNQLARRTPFVFVGNNKYEMERFNIGRRESLNRGELSLYITHRTGRIGLLRLALRALVGGLRNEKDFLALCTRDVWIETRHRRLQVAFDGETAMLEPPLHYSVLPGALRVIVSPPGKQSAE